MRTVFLRTFLGAAALCVVCLPALAQTTGSIRGLIKDEQGNALPGVTVTVTSQGRGVSRSVVTGDGGSFAVPSLTVEVYTVNAVLEGFREQVVENVRVGISTITTLDLVMPLATVEETIMVSATPILDTTSTAVGTNLDAEFIEDLPTNRNFWDMMAVTPGISQEAATSSWKLSAFGSSTAANSWSVDGQNTTEADDGQAFWWINADTIEEVQVLAIGAPAQFGNMSGAAMNVVTKSGTNEFKGWGNFWYQGPDITGENAEIRDIPFRRDQFRDFTLGLGGPIVRDKAWFFVAYENSRDAYRDPGVDSELSTEIFSDKYDVKFNWAVNQSTMLEAKYHYEYWPWKYSEAFVTDSANGSEGDTNPAWGISLDKLFGANTLLELSYSGYTGIDDYVSRTGSQEDAFIDYSPPGGGPPLYSGGLYFPWNWDTERHQLDATVSTFADDFIKGDHDLKFGVSYTSSSNETRISGGPQGRYYYFYEYEYVYDYYGTEYTYLYPYYYRATARGYYYGADNKAWGAFFDDSWRVTDKLTVNLGVRIDDITSDIPAYPKLDRFSEPTGEIIPGVDNAIDWTLISPRIGIAYNVGNKGVLRGYYGKFFDSNVNGKWMSPPPDPAIFIYEFSDSLDGPWEFSHTFEYANNTIDPNLKAPETDQFTLGYEHQLTNVLTMTVQGIYKDMKNLIGWEILGDGVYEMVPWTNPFTGEVEELANIVVQPSTRKGNRPGDGSLAPPGQKYAFDYKGAFVSFNKRYANGWSMMGSYTWSNTNGFLPTPLAQDHGNPQYSSQDGRDPNNWINSEQRLQNDREHMLQLQGNYDLPFKFRGSLVYSYLSGKPYNRQVDVGAGSSQTPLNQGIQTVIAIPATGSVRKPSHNVLDFGLGRPFKAGKRVTIETDIYFLNAFNDGAHDWWQTLVVPPGSDFVPDGYILPRRLMLRLGVRF